MGTSQKTGVIGTAKQEKKSIRNKRIKRIKIVRNIESHPVPVRASSKGCTIRQVNKNRKNTSHRKARLKVEK